MHQAGAGAGVYNTTRQVGSTLGAAVSALVLDARLRAYDLPTTGSGDSGISRMVDPSTASDWSAALAQALWVVPAVFALGIVAALFLELPRHLRTD